MTFSRTREARGATASLYRESSFGQQTKEFSWSLAKVFLLVLISRKVAMSFLTTLLVSLENFLHRDQGKTRREGRNESMMFYLSTDDCSADLHMAGYFQDASFLRCRKYRSDCKKFYGIEKTASP
ncbi:hypothetical protein Y032_0139g2114 [Ancylostoma ceylanicum]|nr:hypothetical protein Y032_0139g2114 [Ancylostoma ceylanicum]